MKGLLSFLSEYWWAPILAISSGVGTLIAIVQTEDAVERALWIGLTIGIPSVIASFQLGRHVSKGVWAWPGSGIAGIRRRSDVSRFGNLDILLGTAKSEVLVTGPTLGLFRVETGWIQERAKDGCSFRIILPDPRDDTLRDLANLLGWYPELLSDLATSFKVFKRLDSVISSERFMIRVSPIMLVCSLIIVDNTRGTADFYLREDNPQQRLCVDLTKGQLLSRCRTHFDWLWSNSEPMNGAGDFDLMISTLEELGAT